MTYFARPAREAFAKAGLRGGLMTYIAGRVAALGPVGAALGSAVLFSFHPSLVERILPRAWTFASASNVLAAREAGARDSLFELLGDEMPSADALWTAAITIESALASEPSHGRAMFAAHRALPRSDDPLTRLWQASTVLREHRGDGHAAVLVTAGVDACEAHVSAIAAGGLAHDWLRFRGFSDQDRAAAQERMCEREFMSTDGTLTAAGYEERATLERRTDEAAAAAWDEVDEGDLVMCEETLTRIADVLARAKVLPDPYPPVG
ncbi:hypothetical protein AB0I53_23705 [Saccharopolyspora sp. NPDC050389]|uniref:SCO6745 family protein n=1 Tax=Saccharopolyspora sp. NPDC050389 TaxID=3155516 RepID=UPI0033E9496D